MPCVILAADIQPVANKSYLHPINVFKYHSSVVVERLGWIIEVAISGKGGTWFTSILTLPLKTNYLIYFFLVLYHNNDREKNCNV